MNMFVKKSLLFVAIMSLASGSLSAQPPRDFDFPAGPVKASSRWVRAALATGIGAMLGFLAGEGVGRSVSWTTQPFKVGCGITGACLAGLAGWSDAISRSPQGCVDRFSEAYNHFLTVDLLREDSTVWLSGSGTDRWPLLELYGKLSMWQVNLDKTIAFGRVLMASPLIYGLGEDVPRTIARKVDVLTAMAALVRDRMSVVSSHPGYQMQQDMRRYHEQMGRDLAARREYERLEREARARRDRDAAYWLSVHEAASGAPHYSSAVGLRHCGLCSGRVYEGKGYRTSCLCPVGSNVYHHLCISTHLKDTQECPKCHMSNPTVHLDAPGASEPLAPAPFEPAYGTQPEPSAPPRDAAHTCALCSGSINATRRYRTECDCKAGTYYYHHKCVARALKEAGDRCPKCFKTGTTVRSAF